MGGKGVVFVTPHTFLLIYLYLAPEKQLKVSSQLLWMFPPCRYQVPPLQLFPAFNVLLENGVAKSLPWAHAQFSSCLSWDLHGYIPMAFGWHLIDLNLQFLSEHAER